MLSAAKRHKAVARYFQRALTSAQPKPPSTPRGGLSKVTPLLIASPVVALGGWIACSEHPQAAAALALHFPSRLGRDVICAARIVLDYESSLRGLEGERYDAEKRRCHLRSADRLQKLCFANGGIYIKLGQVAAQLDHLLPEEYVTTMRKSMLDTCPTSSFQQVVRTITEELGAPPSTLFAEFDEQPIASASLAQVHRAIGHDGKELAVKVQHPGLLDTYAADVATVSILARLIHMLFPAFDYSWLVSEIKSTLPKELDFQEEARNADRCRQNFQGRRSQVRGRLHIPEIRHSLSTARVITMEYIRGIKVTDREAMERRGIQPPEVAKLVSLAFNEMIFTFGDVHCDPHAANMLVRVDQRGRPQLVLLDHGLYKRLPDDLRLEYAGLWHALVFGDVQRIERHTKNMNAGEMYPLFAAMLTQRPWEDIARKSADHLYIPTSASDRKVLQTRALSFKKEINELLGRMPPDLLLLFKTNDCLRAVDLALGQPINTFLMTARECSRALAHHRLLTNPGFGSWLAVQVGKVHLELNLAVLRLMSWWTSFNFGFKS